MLLDLSLEEVHAKTKIHLSYLKALESGRYHELPSSVYVQGYLKTLSRLYSLELSKLLELYQEEHLVVTPNKQLDIRPQSFVTPSFAVTPRTITTTLLSIGFLSILGILGWQVAHITSAPKLTVETPKEGEALPTNNIEVVGHTVPGSELTINNESVPLKSDGSFQQTIYLTLGENQIIIRSSNQFNKSSIVERRVVVSPVAEPNILGETDSAQ